ncbi:hypothetical protein LOC71_22185 [Rhodopirellula sp. JC740]|uniref:DUF2087 domain-containing protein n=1 Tax=Rhodopirellula halodulae TaxID=2894198 RepID=A0ABS8NN54_9BACT|nr:hypothetical protein [Rhodopirellula sp. JC740]MCC9644995.1 hypothetical protein [Rhodopirellula sp. JC740]
MSSFFFRTQTQSYYCSIKLANGKRKQIRLSRDRDRAMEIFEQFYAKARKDEDSKHERLSKLDVGGQSRAGKPPERTTPSSQQSARPKSPKRKPENIRGRYESFERLVLLASLLSPLRRGATAEELHQDTTDLLGRAYCLRTIKRDLEFFVQFGVAETDDGRRFRWLGGNRSNIIEAFADTLAS